jgi:hypothetical protein
VGNVGNVDTNFNFSIGKLLDMERILEGLGVLGVDLV